jgi:alpha-amylase/alpha-mannosidase (GH57 family)
MLHLKQKTAGEVETSQPNVSCIERRTFISVIGQNALIQPGKVPQESKMQEALVPTLVRKSVQQKKTQLATPYTQRVEEGLQMKSMK